MDSININAIYNRLIDEDTYDRIREFNPEDNMQYDYEHFIHWHKRILSELSHSKLQFLATLCDMIVGDDIRSMDEEHCGKMCITTFYYTTEHRLILVTPR